MTQNGNRLGTQALKAVIDLINNEVQKSESLDKDTELVYMKTLIEMATRQDKPISEQERQALIAIRKEYYRRNIIINSLFKDLNKLDRQKDELENENN